MPHKINSRSHKKKRVYRLSRKQHHKLYLDSCRTRNSSEICKSDPNCSRNSEKNTAIREKVIFTPVPLCNFI